MTSGWGSLILIVRWSFRTLGRIYFLGALRVLLLFLHQLQTLLSVHQLVILQIRCIPLFHKRAVSQCPSVPIEVLGQKVLSLLDSGSMVTLVHEGYFLTNILPLLQGSAGKLTEAHLLFQLSTANNEVMLVSKYFEANITILGFKIPWVGFLVVKDPNTLLEPQHSTQLPGLIRCNLIWLGCNEFKRVHGFDAFEEFCCQTNVHPVVFAQMCSFYHQGKLQSQTQTSKVKH